MDEREIRSQIAREIEEMEVKFFDLHSTEAQLLATEVKRRAVEIALGLV